MIMTNDITKKSERGNGQDAYGVETTRGARVYRPATDICETENGVVIAVDMPGAGPDDVDIELEKRVLTIRGRGRQARPEGYRAIYSEYGEGDYERVFSLSEEIDESGIKAAVRDGVLMLELPKAEPAKPKRIQVKAA
jgi:HSP20 family molecular chaperone IbpA